MNGWMSPRKGRTEAGYRKREGRKEGIQRHRDVCVCVSKAKARTGKEWLMYS